MKVTALLLNWKRGDNMTKVIKSIRDQNTKIDIWLWNNNIDDDNSYNVDLQINSPINFKCWPRWLMGSMVSGGYIFTLDDDLMFGRSNVIEGCMNFYENLKSDFPLSILGYTGVIIDNQIDYLKSKHIIDPIYGMDIPVDIVKGRFMFMDSSLLKNVNLEYEPACEDIKISSYSNNKIIPSFLSNGFVDLNQGSESLSSDSNWWGLRTLAVKKYFKK